MYIHPADETETLSMPKEKYMRELWLTTPKINDEMPARSLGYVNAIPMDGNIYFENQNNNSNAKEISSVWGVAGGPFFLRPPPISVTRRAYLYERIKN